MKLEELYRDIYSRSGLQGHDHSIYRDDIVKAINDAVRHLRIEYVRNGTASAFADTETLTSFEEDTDYPFLVSDELSSALLDEVPEHLSIIASTSYITDNEIEDTEQDFDEGVLAFKDNVLYKAVDDIEQLNTYERTFDTRKTRTYSSNNGLSYKKGEVVYDNQSKNYYRVTDDFVAKSGEEELEQLYWRKVGTANKYTTHYPFSGLRDLTIFQSLEEPQGFTIKEKKVYATPSIKKLSLSYVPRWSEVEQMEEDVNIPDFMVSQVKALVLQQITQTLGIDAEINQPELEQQEENDE